MATYEDLLAALGAEMDENHQEIIAALGDIQASIDLILNPTPEPPDPTPDPDSACLSGVYTGANNVSGQAETDFGNWRKREVEQVMTFTPDDKWDTSWWCSVYGGSYPYKDRLVITRGLCLKNENVESPLPSNIFGQWAQAVKNAGIPNPIYRLGHEANGSWYPWKIAGHETTWATRFDLAAKQIHDTDPTAKVMFCLAAGQKTTGFTMPKPESVDVYGVDLYDNGSQVNDWSKHRDIADDYGVPFCVPEWGLWSDDGSGGHGDNPSYIQQMHDLTVADCGDGGSECYFNKDSSSKHKLDHYPNSKQKYLELFGGSNATRNRDEDSIPRRLPLLEVPGLLLGRS